MSETVSKKKARCHHRYERALHIHMFSDKRIQSVYIDLACAKCGKPKNTFIGEILAIGEERNNIDLESKEARDLPVVISMTWRKYCTRWYTNEYFSRNAKICPSCDHWFLIERDQQTICESCEHNERIMEMLRSFDPNGKDVFLMDNCHPHVLPFSALNQGIYHRLPQELRPETNDNEPLNYLLYQTDKYKVIVARLIHDNFETRTDNDNPNWRFIGIAPGMNEVSTVEICGWGSFKKQPDLYLDNYDTPDKTDNKTIKIKNNSGHIIDFLDPQIYIQTLIHTSDEHLSNETAFTHKACFQVVGILRE